MEERKGGFIPCCVFRRTLKPVSVCVFFVLALTPWLPVTNNLTTTGLPRAGHTIFLKVCVFFFCYCLDVLNRVPKKLTDTFFFKAP